MSVGTTYQSENALLHEKFSKQPSDPSRQIQVIGAGYSRTATVSFSLALGKLLNGPVCHGGSASLMREPDFIKSQILALSPSNSPQETQSILKSILAGYVACTDTPFHMLVEELATAYPDAKVIVTTRDPEKWWVSFEDLLKVVMPWWIPYVFWSQPTLRWFGTWCDAIAKRSQIIYAAGGPDSGPKFLEHHYEYIRRSVPTDRLFFFDVKDGWEPLCKILDVPVPDEPFPHANDKLAVTQAFQEMIRGAMWRWFAFMIGPVLSLGWFWWFMINQARAEGRI